MLPAKAWKLVVVSACVVGGIAGGAVLTHASEPPAQTVAVSATPGTQTYSWTGTIPAGSNASSDCTTEDGTPLVDHHGFTFVVPDSGYSGFRTTFTFQISWQPVSGNENTNDEILTVTHQADADAGDTEAQEIGSSDGSDTKETVVATDLAPGSYDAMACGFANVAPTGQPYTGTLTVTTEAQAAEPSLPSADAQGLQFSAAVPADPQRDEAEPLIVSDKAGLLYTCGPTGFSNASDYAQVSTDGGDQFHLLGTPPRGQQGFGGGGDCVVATGETKNARGNYQYAYAGLGALTGFTTSTSPNDGHSIANGGPNGNGLPGATSNGALADRQWMTFLDDHTVLLSYNQQEPRNVVVQRSTDGGLTYSAFSAIAAPNAEFPGPMHYIASKNIVYMPWTKGEEVNLAISQDGGTTWTDCVVDKTKVAGGTAGFSVADNDQAGNVYVVWADSADYHTWMSALPADKLAACNEPVANVAKGTGQPNVNPGFTAPVQVDRDAVRTTVFPWVAAGGADGRVAVAFYGTTQDGDPNVGSFKAAWDVYVNQSLNPLAPDATFSQVKATTHPFHYDSICLNGLACDLSVPSGDRSLADFFAIAYDPVDGRLAATFDRGNKKPDESSGHVATTMVATQIAGPSNGGGMVSVTGRDVVRTSTADPTGDALSSYSVTAPGVVPPDPPTMNESAVDFTSATVGPDAATGGFTVTLKVADLSNAALMQALADTGGQSLLWVWRFTNGYQDAAASARWNPAQGFTFGWNDYSTASATCGSSGEKCVTFPGSTPIQGSADQATGTITLVVPRPVLRALGPDDSHGRPTEVAAIVGSRFYDAEAWSFANNASSTQDVQSFLYTLDSTPAMDFLLPAAPSAPAAPPAAPAPAGGGQAGGGGGTAPAPAPASPAPQAAPPAGGVAGTQTTRTRSVSGHGVVRGKGRAGTASFQVTAAKVVYRSRTQRFSSLSVTSIRFGERSAQLRGVGRANGRRVRFAVVVVDRGATGDVFRIDWGGGTSRGGTVVRGGVTVR